MTKRMIRHAAKRDHRERLRFWRRNRSSSQLDQEEAGIENFVIGDGSELDWSDPDVGYRWQMIHDRS